MANIKSAAKRARTSEKRRLSNSSVRTRIRGLIHRFETAVGKKDVEEARRLLAELTSQIDSATGRGIIHKATGARYKSRLTKAFVPLTKPKPKRASRARKKTAPAPEPAVEVKPEEEKVAAP